ncbi:hypothetical protein SEPCBS119000_005578 [Sporothrix epigloea]|uniref:Mitochondrial outer membrane protein n=1 Tax=Sporothrix epigloea TaxID=1892477 RepID=A0ABP0DYK9_9PEZI
MSNTTSSHSSTSSSTSSASSTSSTSLFPPIPAPLQRLFDAVPLATYPENALPGDESLTEDGSADAPNTDVDHTDRLPTLHVFIDPADAARGRASFNPTCLKWQTYLRFAGIPVRTITSSNHASPTGALPFLQPARNRAIPTGTTTSARQLPSRPISASDFPAWVAKTATSSSAPPATLRDHARAAAYQSLLDSSLRRAWLHAVYLDEPRDRQGKKGPPMAVRLYAHAASASTLVRMALARQLYTAAAAEVWGSQQNLSRATPKATAQIYRDAESALAALATVLGGDEFFFGSAEPTLFDAAVFSYTHLLLEDADDNDGAAPRLPWQNCVLPDMVRAHPQLVQHRDRIVAKYWTTRA